MSIDLGHVVLVGAGNMGGAMLRRWPGNADVTVIDPQPSDDIMSYLSERGVAYESNPQHVRPADILVIAVKPQLMGGVLPTLRPLVGEPTIVISIAAGTTVATLERELGTRRIVRTIPNTPAMIGEGVTGAFASAEIDTGAKAKAAALLECSGPVVWVTEEADIDKVTAVSGSGPAYVFHMVEALTDAARSLGLDDEQARVLARQTVTGAGALLADSTEEAGVLRQRVTSPGGTTAAALNVLMDGNALITLMQRAVTAAHERAVELGRNA